MLTELTHVETDIFLSLLLGREVRDRHLAAVAVTGQHLGNAQTGLSGIVERVAEQSGDFLRGMEAGSVAGHGIVPAPLALADVSQSGGHLLLVGAFLPGEGGFDMRCGEFFLYLGTHLKHLLLALIDILAQRLGVLTVAGLARAVDMGQRRHDVVIGIFHASLLDVRHVAVGAGKATLTMYALLEDLITGMLSLQNLGMGQRMDIVVEADTVVVSLGILACQAFVLREFEVVGAFLEVVLRVALRADE